MFARDQGAPVPEPCQPLERGARIENQLVVGSDSDCGRLKGRIWKFFLAFSMLAVNVSSFATGHDAISKDAIVLTREDDALFALIVLTDREIEDAIAANAPKSVERVDRHTVFDSVRISPTESERARSRLISRQQLLIKRLTDRQVARFLRVAETRLVTNVDLFIDDPSYPADNRRGEVIDTLGQLIKTRKVNKETASEMLRIVDVTIIPVRPDPKRSGPQRPNQESLYRRLFSERDVRELLLQIISR